MVSTLFVIAFALILVGALEVTDRYLVERDKNNDRSKRFRD